MKLIRCTVAAAVAVLISAATTFPAHAGPLTLRWSWTSSSVLPDFLNVMNTPSVMDLNSDGSPEVIFGATNSTGGWAG